MGQEKAKDLSLEDIAQETEELLEIRYLNKDNAVFRRTPGGFVSLDYQGRHYDRVSVYRAFPFSDPDKYISIREPDEKAKEIGMVEDLRALDKDTAAMLTEQMNIRYFTPVITRILDIKDEYGYAYFDVLTDRGACRFTIHMNGGSVVRLTDTRLLISDLDGNRFEIPDTGKLSAGELKKLDLFI
ncbi:MAG: DUF1854 domain-containing protein [Clostridiales bacterium]|nr:DUF1854 domain-containing protein [Clostridiales bacterium]